MKIKKLKKHYESHEYIINDMIIQNCKINNCKYSKPDNLNIICGNNMDKRYIRYNIKNFSDFEQIYELSRHEYTSRHQPCTSSNNKEKQECIYEYDLNPLNITKFFQTREYATCIWLQLDSIFTINCNGNCSDNIAYSFYDINM